VKAEPTNKNFTPKTINLTAAISPNEPKSQPQMVYIEASASDSIENFQYLDRTECSNEENLQLLHTDDNLISEEQEASDFISHDNLNEINERLRQAKSVQQWIKLETEFHGTLVSASGLRGLSAFNDLLQVFFRRFRADFPLVQWKMAAKSHQEIIDALRGGDHLSATDLLTQHIESLRERINRTNEANKKLAKNGDGRANGKST